MSTRSLTIVNESTDLNPSEEIFIMYRQYDGYPNSHGADLIKFLKNCVMTNGIPVGKNDLKEKHFSNGFADLSAKLITYFKEDYHNAGHFYLYKAGTRDYGEEYIYTIYPNKNNQEVINLKIESLYNGGKVLYNGPANELNVQKLE